MVESVCGQGVIREVERNLRPKVKFELQQEEQRNAKGKADLTEMREKAQRLFNDLSERLNMRCPRCEVVFFDYDGCNAHCVLCNLPARL